MLESSPRAVTMDDELDEIDLTILIQSIALTSSSNIVAVWRFRFLRNCHDVLIFQEGEGEFHAIQRRHGKQQVNDAVSHVN